MFAIRSAPIRCVALLLLAFALASPGYAAAPPAEGPPGGFQRVVVFGDSLSDDGAYTLAAVLHERAGSPYRVPYERGGQFSVNSPTSANWTDRLAQRLGLKLGPALVGFRVEAWDLFLTPQSLVRSIDKANCAFDPGAGGPLPLCTNHAQGGARVTDKRGIGYDEGALTYPVTLQWQRHLEQFGVPGPRDLVIVLAGSNDVLAAFVDSQRNSAIRLPRSLELRPSGSPPEPASPRGSGGQPTSPAEARDQVELAADQLAALVKDMLGRGAPFVAVGTLPDSSLSPYGQRLAGGSRCDRDDPATPCHALSQLVGAFNQRLQQDLDGQPVQWLDTHGWFEQLMGQPARFGLDNVRQPWCDPDTGSSLLCTLDTPYAEAGATVQNLPSWLFADELHPTPAGHQALADLAWQQLQASGWLGG